MAKVAVTGAFSYSGRYLTKLLLDAGHSVVSLSARQKPLAPEPLSQAEAARVDARPLNFRDERALATALEGCEVLWCTYWIRFGLGGDTHDAAADRCAALFEIARKVGVQRVVFTSHTHASESSPYEYIAVFTGGVGGWPYQPVVAGGGEQAPAEEHGRRDLRRLSADSDGGPASPPWRSRAAALGLLFGLLACLSVAFCLWGRLSPVRVARPRLMLDQATPSVVQDGEPPASYCLDSDQLGDFSSQERMQQAGWLFGWTGVDAFKPQKELYASSVPTSSYWGFSGSVDGEIALVLRGRGFVGLDFGNAWTGLGSQVVVYLNGMPQSRAGAYAISVFVKAPFRDGDVLRLVESNGVIVINSIFFDCVSVLPAKVTAPAPLQAISTSAAITTASETETASTTTLATTTQTTSATTQTLTFSAPSGTTIRDTTTLQEHAPLHRQREPDRDAPKASRDQRVSEPEHADHGKEEPAMSDIKALRLRAKKQQQYESHMSEAVARESKKLEELEDMEKEQLLKAQRDMQLEKDLKEELHRMVHG